MTLLTLFVGINKNELGTGETPIGPRGPDVEARAEGAPPFPGSDPLDSGADD